LYKRKKYLLVTAAAIVLFGATWSAMKFLKKSGTKAFDIPMMSPCGWNLVSVPFIPKVRETDLVFSQSCGVWVYDPVKGMYIWPDKIELGKSYWVCYFEEKSLRVLGKPAPSYSLSLAKGWHMIGSVSEPVDFKNLVTNPARCIVSGSLFGFDLSNCQYIPVTTIEPGKGYWIEVLKPCKLTVSSLVKGVAAPKVIPLTWSFTLHLESDDRSKDLTIGVADKFDPLQDISTLPVPPVVGFEKFDAYLEGNLQGRPRLTRSIKETDATITWSAFVKSYTSFTLSWDTVGIPKGYGFTLNIDGQRIDMKQQCSYSRKSTDGKYLIFRIIVLSL
jgi:hypothetical protein